ncbi:tail fiber domain-containing protein [Cupriavidus sp.]|uniref:tail fiber domain-containing protein n=1 Tax=Cupriavidus sp. TaxID=1873897 RepID=UPI003D0C616D
MTSVTFTPDVGGDNITIDDSDSATTGLGNGGHRTRFMIALAQFMKVVVWVKATAQTVLGYRDAAATSASQALTYAGLAQSAAGVPSYAGKGNQVMTVNPGATGVQWTNAPNLSVMTLTHTQPLVRYMESDQAGAVGVFQTQVEGGAYALLRNTAAARDFSTNVAEHQVNSAGRHLFGGGADNNTDKFQFQGDLMVNGYLKASLNVTLTSDVRVKRDIVTIEDGLGMVERMHGRRYTRSDIGDGRVHVGVIAQELREVLPEAVIEGADGLLSVDYGTLGPVLIEAVKALSLRVRQLEGDRV